MSIKEKQRPVEVGLEVEIPGPEGTQRGWISERGTGDQVIVTVYESQEEVTLDPAQIIGSSLYGPELPVPEGWAAIDLGSEDGEELIISMRVTSSEYRFWEKSAESFGKETGEFIRLCIISGLEDELAKQRSSRTGTEQASS